jgi:hypothetical protein
MWRTSPRRTARAPGLRQLLKRSHTPFTVGWHARPHRIPRTSRDDVCLVTCGTARAPRRVRRVQCAALAVCGTSPRCVIKTDASTERWRCGWRRSKVKQPSVWAAHPNRLLSWLVVACKRMRARSGGAASGGAVNRWLNRSHAQLNRSRAQQHEPIRAWDRSVAILRWDRFRAG